MEIFIATPAAPAKHTGNLTTATRWASFLEDQNHKVEAGEEWNGGDVDLLIALHARKSHSSAKSFKEAHPKRPLIVVLTGTDLYKDLPENPEARESLEIATRLIVLQDAALEELPTRYREKARVIYQSAEPVSPAAHSESHFDVSIIGNLRSEKDPFRTALAVRLLPDGSRIRVTHFGAAYSEGSAEEARSHASAEPRYRWLGEVSHQTVRDTLSMSRLLVQSSLMEGGANAISEALAASVPILASKVPGNTGMLGEDYPGYFPPGDEKALAKLLTKAETSVAFYAALQEKCAERSMLVTPERERSMLRAVIEETARISQHPAPR